MNSAVGGPLSAIDTVIAKYPNLQCEKNATRMAVKLARKQSSGLMCWPNIHNLEMPQIYAHFLIDVN